MTTTPKKPGSFLSQIVIYGLGMAVNYGIGFILLPFYSRLMPTEQYGIMEILNRTIEIVSLLLLTQYGITYVRFFRDRDDSDYQRRVTGTSIYVVFAISAVVTVALTLAREPVSALLFDTAEYGYYVVLVAVRYLLDMLFVVPLLFYQATEQPTKYIAISAARLALTLGLNIVLLYTMDDKVAAVLWAQILSIGVFVVTVGVNVFARSALRIDMGLAKQILKFTWSFSFIGAYTFVLSSADRFFINEYCGQAAVGIYSAGFRIGQIFSVLIFSPVLRAWSPRLVEQLRTAEGARNLARLTTWTLLVYLLCAVTLSVYARELVAVVIGPKYFDCYSLVPLIALAHFFSGFSFFVDGGIYYSKKTYLKVWHGITTAICLLFCFILVPKYCGTGAAWALIISSISLAGLNWYLSYRAYPMKYEFGKLLRILAIGVLVYLGAWMLEAIELRYFEHFVSALLISSKWLYFAVMIVIKLPLVWLFVALVWVAKIFEPQDRERLKAIINDLRQRVPGLKQTPPPADLPA